MVMLLRNYIDKKEEYKQRWDEEQKPDWPQ